MKIGDTVITTNVDKIWSRTIFKGKIDDNRTFENGLIATLSQSDLEGCEDELMLTFEENGITYSSQSFSEKELESFCKVIETQQGMTDRELIIFLTEQIYRLLCEGNEPDLDKIKDELKRRNIDFDDIFLY